MTRHLADEVRTGNGGSINRHLVGTRSEDMPGILDRANPAADGNRHKDLIRGAPDDVTQIVAAIEARHDVHIDQLVRPGLVVADREFLRVSHDPQALELDTLDEIFPLDIEPGDDPEITQTCLLAGFETLFIPDSVTQLPVVADPLPQLGGTEIIRQ